MIRGIFPTVVSRSSWRSGIIRSNMQYWSPLAFIEQLIGLGADLNYQHHAGFPSLIAALSSDRADKNGVLKLLLETAPMWDNGA
jgi:hypothetical protein